MLKFAVIGNPIAHSQSPSIHQAFALQYQLILSYTALYSPIEQFEQRVKVFFEEGGEGLNITSPFKERAFLLAEQQNPTAQLARAANVLTLQTDGTLLASNTDGQGLIHDLTINLG